MRGGLAHWGTTEPGQFAPAEVVSTKSNKTMPNKSKPSEPPAPWIKYPESSPAWGGFRQGFSEAWFNETWLTFWQSLDSDARTDFLKRYPPPADIGWAAYLDQCVESMIELQQKGLVDSNNRQIVPDATDKPNWNFLPIVWQSVKGFFWP